MIFCVFCNVGKMQCQSQLDPQLGTQKAQLRAKTPQLGGNMVPRPPNLEPIWTQDPSTWSQDGPKTPHLGEKWHQDPLTWSRERPKTPQLGAKWHQRPSNLEPRWHQDPPTWSQMAPKTLQLGAKMAPKTPQLGAWDLQLEQGPAAGGGALKIYVTIKKRKLAQGPTGLRLKTFCLTQQSKFVTKSQQLCATRLTSYTLEPTM